MKVESLTGNNIKPRFGDSETTKFGIAEEAQGLIMKYLTDLYDDPTLAAIRETISNAIDAHTEAKTSEKVEITVSSYDSNNRFFEVTDHGVGMSRDTLTNVYTQYGVSTKSGDDEAIGGFGLGCKSPLAIEDRFYISTTQNGTTVVAEIYKNNGGEFVLDINDEYPTSDSNSTTVRINLEKTYIGTFTEKLRQFLGFVDPSLYTAKTNTGAEFEASYILDNKEKYHLITDTDEFKVYANLTPDYYDVPKIVMGNVSYDFKIPDTITAKTKLGRDSLKVVIVAPINSVTITTSRENTQDTKKTKLFLEKVYTQFEKDVNAYFQNYIDQADAPIEVYKRVREANRFARRDYKYQDEAIVDQITLDKNTLYAAKTFGSAPTRGTTRHVSIGGNDRVFFVMEDGTPETKEGAITRAYNAFLSHRKLNSGTFYFLDKEQARLDSWWVTENPYIVFINKGDILKEASEYRKEQRRINGTGGNRRATGKVKYTIADNSDSERISFEDIEYPDVEKGIPYLTMEDIVAYGITRNPSTPVREFRNGLKRFLDFFDFNEEVLVLDKGKKEETMLKRVAGEKLEFDFLSLDKHTKAARNRAYLLQVNQTNSSLQRLKKQVGEDNYNRLIDPRFSKYLEKEDMGETMDEATYTNMYRILSEAFVYSQNEYFYTNQEKLAELRSTWRGMGSYWYHNHRQDDNTYKMESLLSTYKNYVDFYLGSTNKSLVVDIYNLIYENYLTPSEKVL